MLKKENMHHYQEFSVSHIVAHPAAGLFQEMGLGKTVSTLTAIDILMFDTFEIKKPLIIAPLNVAKYTWQDEIDNWAHLKHLKLGKILGDEKSRSKALNSPADIYIINRENVAWLVGKVGSAFPFDMLILDELTSFKSSKAIRFKALKQIRPLVKRVVGLTGTPSPNGYIDLWSQIFLLDQGERLGKFKTHFIDRFFTVDPKTAYSGYPKQIPRDFSLEAIQGLIGDICISMKSEDYLELPGRVHRIINVHLSDAELTAYEEFEESQIMLLPEGEAISVANAAALRGKLVQFANGAVYDENRAYHVVHDAKLDLLEELIDVATSPVLIFYRFKHDLDRMQKRLKAYAPRLLTSEKDKNDWNEGKIKVLLAHPASAGHGLNLQKGGNNVIWFGDPDSLELYQQANARLDRQGQVKQVIIQHMATVGTIDEAIAQALIGKADVQEALMQAIKARVKKYRD
jgi:SNF2 family DNA or RNA helicase